jgi:ATP-binding cassette, subfamily G (WHITE), member 2, SNQ2
VYFGDIGSDSHLIREYFARHGAVCPPNVNPAEFMLEVTSNITLLASFKITNFNLQAIGAGVTPRVGDRDWKDIWLDSPEYQKVLDEIAQIKKEAQALPVEDRKKLRTCECPQTFGYGKPSDIYIVATPFIYQLKTVVMRNNIALWRSPAYVFSRLYLHVLVPLFVSLSYLQLGNSVRDLQYRIFGMYVCIII